MIKQSHLELKFELILKTIPNIKYTKEFRFDPDRRWRVDFFIPQYKIAVEVEGGIYQNGRHTRISGFIKDVEKYNALALKGITLLRFTANEIEKNSLYVRNSILQLINNEERK